MVKMWGLRGKGNTHYGGENLLRQRLEIGGDRPRMTCETWETIKPPVWYTCETSWENEVPLLLERKK